MQLLFGNFQLTKRMNDKYSYIFYKTIPTKYWPQNLQIILLVSFKYQNELMILNLTAHFLATQYSILPPGIWLQKRGESALKLDLPFYKYWDKKNLKYLSQRVHDKLSKCNWYMMNCITTPQRFFETNLMFKNHPLVE